MIESIQALFNIDYVKFVINVFTLLIAIKVVSELLDWLFVRKLGLKTRRMLEKQKEQELLNKTAQGLEELKIKHETDVQQSIKHDKEIKEDLHNFMEEMKKTISDTQSETVRYAENRVKDREQSRKIQKELIDSQNKLAESQSKMSHTMNEISKNLNKMKTDTDIRFAEGELRIKHNEEISNERIRAELKDRISQAYRCYHSKGKITHMELESLEALIKSYESLPNGNNSFVHSIVQKELYTWELVDE